MFLNLNHQKLEASKSLRIFVLECYKITKQFPSEERFILSSQIRRAALSVHLNIAEGASRKSEIERKRFYEIARGSIIEIDAAFDIAYELKYFDKPSVELLGITLINCFKILSGLIRTSN
jgi:four helix bundle protein